MSKTFDIFDRVIEFSLAGLVLSLAACLIFTKIASADATVSNGSLGSQFDTSDLLAHGSSLGLSGNLGVNSMTLSQTLSIPLVKTSGRAGVGLDLQLLFNNNFWSNSVTHTLPYTYSLQPPLWSSRSINGYSAAGTPPIILPINANGGWSLDSPSGARLSHVVFGTSNFFSGSGLQSNPCAFTNHYFIYTTPSGGQVFFSPTTAPANINLDCSNISATQYMNILNQIAASPMYSEDGSGTKLVATGSTRTIPGPSGPLTGEVVQVIDSSGNTTDFIMEAVPKLFFNSTGGQGQVLASGIPSRAGDRFGNAITISFDVPSSATATPNINTVTLTDTVGRDVVINYGGGPDPQSVTYKGFGPGSTDYTIGFQWTTLYFLPPQFTLKNPSLGVASMAVDPAGLTWTGAVQFWTVSEVDFPGGLSWKMSYDRGWAPVTSVGTGGTTAGAPSTSTSWNDCQLFSASWTGNSSTGKSCSPGGCECDGSVCYNIPLNGAIPISAFCGTSGSCVTAQECNANGTAPPPGYAGSCCYYTVPANGPTYTDSDGSIAKLTTPTGQVINYTLGNDGPRPTGGTAAQVFEQLYTHLSYFLDSSVGALTDIRLGYVQAAQSYLDGTLDSQVTFSTLVNTPYTSTGLCSPGVAPTSTTATTTINYEDPSGTVLKRETLVFTNRSVEITNDSSAVVDELSGKLLLSTSTSYQCTAVDVPGAPQLATNFTPQCGPSGYVGRGFCVPTNETTVKYGVSTAATHVYQTGSTDAELERDVYTPINGYRQNYVPRLGESDEYDGATLVRKTTTTYATAASLLNANLIGLPSNQTVQDGTGATVSSIDTGYDTEPVASVALSSAQNFFGGTAIGLPTSRTTHDPTGVLPVLTTTTQFNQAGQGVVATDARGNSTTTTYDPTNGCQGAFPTQVSNALGQPSKTWYNCYNGTVSFSADVNGVANGYSTSFQYNDPLNRLTGVLHPDGTSETHSYNDIALTHTKETLSASSNLLTTEIDSVDSLSRITQVQTTNPNGAGMVTTSKSYDALGRVKTATNPYGNTTTYSYDALDRKIATNLPNGTSTSTSISGRTVSVTDIYGRSTSSTADYFGNVISIVSEDDTTTSYAYNNMNKLKSVQLPSDASPSRTFNYDGFGRITSSVIPEQAASDQVVAFDGNGNPVQIATAMGYVVQSSYDALNRPTSRSYSGGAVPTPALSFTYDTATNGTGKLARISQGTISRSFSYDPMGRVAYETLAVGPSSYPLSYSYDPDKGSIQTVTLPSGLTSHYSYNSTGLTSNVAWTGGMGTSGAGYTINSYAPHGPIAQRTFGNGLSQTDTYDPQMLLITGRSTGSLLDFTYHYSTQPGCGGANAASGAILGGVDEQVGASFSRHLSFTYDCLGRLKNAGSTGGDSWTLAYGFDPNFNRTSQTGVAAITSNLSFDSRNHIAGYLYDPAGNVTNDGKTTYTYDGAGHLVSSRTGSTTTTYAYLEAQRISQTAGGTETDYVRDSGGNLYSEFSGSATPSGTSEAKYYHEDLLGSTRMVSGPSGAVLSTHNFYPYGEEEVPSPDGVTLLFTGSQRDSQTGNDYMKARYYESTAGIFLAVDKGQPDLSRPMTWNRYNYTASDPVNKVDPTGNSDVWDQTVQKGKSLAAATWEGTKQLGNSAYDVFVKPFADLAASDDLQNLNLALTQMGPYGAGAAEAFQGLGALGKVITGSVTGASEAGAATAMTSALPSTEVLNLMGQSNPSKRAADLVEESASAINGMIYNSLGKTPPEKILTVIAHGSPNSMAFGEYGGALQGEAGAATIARYAQQVGSKDVTLFSCSTGCGADSFAETLSKQGLNVVAPSNTLAVTSEAGLIKKFNVTHGAWRRFPAQDH